MQVSPFLPFSLPPPLPFSHLPLLPSSPLTIPLSPPQHSHSSDRKAGVPSFSAASEPEDPDGTNECLVCMDDYKNSESFALPCGHRYCALCWQNYLEVKVDEGMGVSIIQFFGPKLDFPVKKRTRVHSSEMHGTILSLCCS